MLFIEEEQEHARLLARAFQALGGAVYLLPIYAEDILHMGAAGFGWLRAALAMGALCMAVR